MAFAKRSSNPPETSIVSDIPQNAVSPDNPLAAYHARTRHRFEAFAEGPGQLDWDAQPCAFRHYAGAPVELLPLAAQRFDRPFGDLDAPPATPIAADVASLGALLELAFGLSAWKSWGASRWALRCNPSSGNLHPVEAFVLTAGLPGLADGLHHYDPERHAAEGRALVPTDGGRWLAVGLSSVMWREAWKYGERAFRYCQLDVGHAVAALAYAAALLGWEVAPLTLPSATLARLLGLDREADFPSGRLSFTEDEEPEIMLAIRASGLQAPPAGPALIDWLAPASWYGSPSAIDPSPGYRWPIVDKAAHFSRRPADALPALHPNFPALPPLPAHPTAGSAAQLIRQRRSGQRFDPRETLPRAAFYRMLDALLPRPRAPFSAQESDPAIHLLLFVMRVDGLPSGLYLLPRTPATEIPSGLGAPRPVHDFASDCPAHLNLVLLAALGLQEVQRLARALSCHQDIASTSAFSLGMVADFSGLGADGHAYRSLLREAGIVGQVLYLEAEAAGVRGTGIGCFFDEPVHQAFGLSDPHWQSVYHFTVGTPVLDARIETSPPYPQRHQENP